MSRHQFVGPLQGLTDFSIPSPLSWKLSKDILTKFAVEYTSIRLHVRQSKFYPEEVPIPAVLVQAKRRAIDESWLFAAQRIHQKLLQRSYQNIQVEIAQQETLEPLTCSPVLCTVAVFSRCMHGHYSPRSVGQTPSIRGKRAWSLIICISIDLYRGSYIWFCLPCKLSSHVTS